jgi:hypothetical protein
MCNTPKAKRRRTLRRLALLALSLAALTSAIFVCSYFTILRLGTQAVQSLGVNSTQYLHLVNEWGHGFNWLIVIATILLFTYLALLGSLSGLSQFAPTDTRRYSTVTAITLYK